MKHRRLKSENAGGRGEKTQNFGPPTLRAPTLRGPTLRGLIFLDLGPTFGPTMTHQIQKMDWPKLDWPKLDWPKFAGPKPRWPNIDWPTLDWPKAKTGLAKVGFFRSVGSPAPLTLEEGWLGAWPKSATQILAKVCQLRLAKVGQIRMAKVGLPKVGISRSIMEKGFM